MRGEHLEDATLTVADYLRKEFSYNAWANRAVVESIRVDVAGNARSLQLISHIFAAERLWLERLRQVPQSGPVWPEPDLTRCESDAADLNRKWNEYLELATSGDLQQTISYKNSKGESWTSAVLDVLTHVIMHSAYHRGQIASQMRSIGQAPAYTDFIHAVRQGLVE